MPFSRSRQVCPVPVVLVVSGLVYGQWAISDEPLTVVPQKVSIFLRVGVRADKQEHGRKTCISSKARKSLTHRYTYTSCDVGTLANQTWPNGTSPEAALNTGAEGDVLSYLPGQRLSACTCPGEDHPGPDVSVGRAAPEIDLVEAQIKLSLQHGEVSQSFQVAPFDDYYQSDNTTGKARIYDEDMTQYNSYLGGHYQQAVSGLTLLPDRIYYDQQVGGRSKEFATFSFEYSAFPEEREKGYIHWVTDGKPAWTMFADAVGPNPRTEIGRRIVPEEPMYMVRLVLLLCDTR